jgi:Ca-activated chloride channel family protein
MNETDAPGPRIDAAKIAARGLIDGLPDDATAALETYGTSTGSTDAEQAVGCTDVKTLIPLGKLDRDQMHAQIGALRASGYTPITLALRTAAAQLPTDGSAQAIVLVSDGEDTCGTPPCAAAKELKQAHPGLTISTVGFKTDGPASEQLNCIATATGGVFVQAQNASQLAARLLATQNVSQARGSLSSDGIDGITLGANAADTRNAHQDFPVVNGSGSVTVVYRDCDFTFVDGVLDSIAPHGGGRTIDGVTAGTLLTRATELYGDPLQVIRNPDGTVTVVYAANADQTTAYRMGVSDFSGATVSGTVTTIVLCRCAPKKAPASSGNWSDPLVFITPTALGAVQLGMSQADAQTAAGVPFTGQGDGAHYPDALPGGPELFWTAGCLGAGGQPASASVQAVRTTEGVQIGDDVAKLTGTYGAQLRYVPAPNGGRVSVEGYVIDYPQSTMAFKVNDDHVVGITIGPRGHNDPSDCGG